MTDLATVVSMAMTTRNVPAGELSSVHREVPKCMLENPYSSAIVLVWDGLGGASGRGMLSHCLTLLTCVHHSEPTARALKTHLFYPHF